MEDLDWIRDIKMTTTLEYPESWSGEILSREDARRFKHLTYIHGDSFDERNLSSFRKMCETILDGENQLSNAWHIKQTSEKLEVFILADKYNITETDLRLLCRENAKIKRSNRSVYSTRPIREGRDNKGVYVGRGGSWGNKIRYPKKNRSKSTWKKFYEMFPGAAEYDGWDGSKSSKVNFNKKKRC